MTRSYKSDPNVPAFDDSAPIAFMDGECTLCSFGARAIARLDRTGTFQICPVQTPLGQAILNHYGLAADDPESWLFLADGQAHRNMDAVIEVGHRTGGVGTLLIGLKFIPKALRDRLYFAVARNRYALFGRRDMCGIPDENLRRRLMF